MSDESELAIGDRIRVIGMVLTGFEGQITGFDSGRVVVSLDLGGRLVPAEFEPEDLMRVGDSYT